MKHRQEYRMKLKRLIKKYNRICKKASAIYRELVYQYEEQYEEAWLLNDKVKCKQLMNSLYGRYTTSYVDTDSIKDSAIYKDFNKKSEV